MATGITVKSPDTGGVVKDIDDLFELIRVGDPQSSLTNLRVGSIDLRTRYTAVAAGTALAYDIRHRVNMVDIGDIFAAKNSVPRYPTPLPWDRTIPAEVLIYRQPSRPTHTVSVVLSISINRTGSVAITLTKPPYNSNPATPVVETIYSSGSTPIWTDAGASPNCPYEVKVDAVSGIAPTLAHGHTLGTWINPNIVVGVENVTMFARLDYSHSTLEGLKTGTSRVRISVRRTEYPVSNTANAVVTANFEIDVEPTVFQDLAWTGTHTAQNNAATNYYWPEGQQNVYKAAVRFTLSTTRMYTLERATWKNAETPVWTTIKTAQWLRDGFSLSDFEAMFTTAGTFDANDTAIVLNQWLQLGSTARSFTIYHESSDNAVAGTYSDTLTMTTRLQQISTKNWPDLPNNFAENAMTLTPSITIQAPLLPSWIATYPWETARNHVTTITREPETSATVTVGVYLRLYADGSATVVNHAGTVLATGRWMDATWDETWFDIRITGDVITNPFASYASPTSPYTEVVLSRQSYTHTTVEGTYSETASFDVNIRRKLYVAHNDTGSGTSLSRITVNAPVAPTWPSLTDLAGPFAETKNVNHTPEGDGGITTSEISVVANTNGTVTVHNSTGAVLDTIPFLPATLTISQVEVRIVSAGAISNSLSNWTTLSTATGAVIARRSVDSDSAITGYSDTDTFTFEVRRKAYPAHATSGSGTATATVNVIAPVVPAWPSLAGIDGPFAQSKSGAHTPEGGGSTLTSRIRLVVGLDGTAGVYNSDGTLLGSATWKPATLTVAQLEVRIVAAGAPTNNLSNWTTLTTGAGEAIISQTAVSTNDAVNGYSESRNFTFEVRRKAYTSHSNSVSASTVSTVNITAPVAPSWIATYPWEGALNHLKSHTRNTDDVNATVTASVTVIFYQNGGVVAVNGDGGTIASGSWVPPGFSASQFTLQVSGSGLIRNDLATAQVISAFGAAVDMTSVTYGNWMAEGTYDDGASMTVTIRRAAYTSQSDSGASTSLSRVTVAPMPITIWPATDFDNWAGGYTAVVTGAI